MVDLMARRDELADELDDEGWEVVDTFGALEEHPAVVVAVDEFELDGETLPRAEVTLLVTATGVEADRVEVSDNDVSLSEGQRDLLDEVCSERLSGPEITVWEYDPGSRDDATDEVVGAVEDVYEGVAA